MRIIRTLLFLALSVAYYSTQAQVTPPGKGYKPIVLDTTYEHTKWGVSPADKLYQFAAYTTSFDSNDDNNGDGKPEVWGIPEWVAFEVKKETDEGPGKYNRPKWATDDALYKAGQAPNDATYAVSGTRSIKEVKTDYRYVRGHMCPKASADRISKEAGSNTHTVLNAVPQLQWQNNGIWKQLEKRTNEWADTYNRVWVVCGPVFFGQSPAVWLGQEGEVKAAVPDALYKIIIREADMETGLQTLAFLMPNVLPKDKKNLSEYLTDIARLQELTGLEFLTELPTEKRTIELNRNHDLQDRDVVLEGW